MTRASRVLMLRLPLAFAAVATASAALACGPMGGSGQGGNSGSGHGSDDGSGRDNGAAERMRQGAADGAGADGGGDVGPRRSSDSQPGSQDLTGAIGALGAAQAADGDGGYDPNSPENRLADRKARAAAQEAQDAEARRLAAETGYDGPTDRINPDWIAYQSLPWWQRATGFLKQEAGIDLNEDDPIEPPMIKDVEFPVVKHYPSYTEVDVAAAAAERASGKPPPPPWHPPTQAERDADAAAVLARQQQFGPADPDAFKNPAWLQYKSLPWYQQWMTTEPPERLPDRNYHPPQSAGARG